MRTILGLLVLVALVAAEPEPERVPPIIDLKNTKDPVADSAARPGNDIVWRGLRIHFSNAATATKFQAKPDGYLDKLGIARTGKLIDLKNSKCPATGKAVDNKTFADVEGVRTRLSGPEARAKFAADPAAAYKRLGYKYEPSVIDLRNTTCPVTGSECYPEAPIWADVEGIRIRVCCDKCVRYANENPKETLKLMMVDPAKLKKKLAPK